MLPGGHWAGSSANTNAGARPCARRGSEPITFNLEPSGRYSISAMPVESLIRQSRLAASKAGERNQSVCSKHKCACPKLDATITTSPRSWDNGPLRQAAPIAATNDVLPLPRAKVNAAVVTFGANAPRRNRRSQGSNLTGCPANGPWDTFKP